jgi:hypothetical protein
VRQWLAAALLLLTPAISQAEPDWDAVDKRTETTYKVSNYALLGGVALSLTGSVTDKQSLRLGGDLTYATATAAMSAAALRQRKSIVERGVPVTPAWGYASWGLQAGAMALGTSLFYYLDALEYDASRQLRKHDRDRVIGMGIGGLACSIGAVLTASKQHHENTYARSLIGRAAARARTTQGPIVAVQPMIGVDGTAGVGATALF